MVVNDHTRSAENWKCVWYLLRLYTPVYIYIYIYRAYVDSHSLGQLALASKRTASHYKIISSWYGQNLGEIHKLRFKNIRGYT